ncbi:Uncharacterized mitochondrial protein AtMg00850, partial [Striga hermonthica]
KDTQQQGDVRELLEEFEGVLGEPKGLPPHREFHHRIPLVNEQHAIHVHPYRYAHFQKTEIERQVAEMLESGLIQHSKSPFSSPVLLAKKKDGTWRFCTDYRALNAATIKDRFPIPSVDDMLDELAGSRYFSKLDLRAGYHQIRLHRADIPKTAFRTHQGTMGIWLCHSACATPHPLSIYVKEMLAVVEAVRCWRPYLLGRRFQIVTDQQPLKHLLEQRIVTPEQQKFVSKLMGFDFEIIYRPGRQNAVADALSRRTDVPELSAITGPTWAIWEEIRKAQVEDTHCQELRQSIEAGKTTAIDYELHNDLLLHRGRVYVPDSGQLREQILQHFHDSKVGGHSGIYRTWMRIANTFFWPGQQGTVRDYIARCDDCQRTKSDSRRPGGLLQPLPVPEAIWEDITMDFIEGLPNSNGFDGVMIVVDRLTKYAHFIPITHPYTAKSIARLFVEYVMKLHGAPRSIVSDRDRIFMSSF